MGKLPAGSVNEEKLKDLEKFEEAKNQKILWRYKVFCGNVYVFLKALMISYNFLLQVLIALLTKISSLFLSNRLKLKQSRLKDMMNPFKKLWWI